MVLETLLAASGDGVTKDTVTLAGQAWTRIDYGDGGTLDYVLTDGANVIVITTADAALAEQAAAALPYGWTVLGLPRTAPFLTFPLQGGSAYAPRTGGPRRQHGGHRGGVVREPLVAWAGDCMVRGSVGLGEGRLSDRVNELDVVTFFDATLRSLRRRPRGQRRRAGGRARARCTSSRSGGVAATPTGGCGPWRSASRSSSDRSRSPAISTARRTPTRWPPCAAGPTSCP